MHDRKRLRAEIVDALEEQIAVIDREGVIVDVNAAWTRFGADNGLPSGQAVVGTNYLDVLRTAASSGDTLAADAARGILDVIEARLASFQFEYPCHSPEKRRWFMMHVTSLGHRRQGLFVIAHTDITARKLAEERAEHLALHDPLTGLANRRYFDERLDVGLRRSRRNHSPLTLVEVDIDHFKAYNDAHGHLGGDQCLAKIGAALQEAGKRPGDLAARLGGDEFALILEDTDAAAAADIIASIREDVHAMGLTYGAHGRATVSIGAVSVTPDGKHSERTLLETADRALYHAKQTGRDRVVHLRGDEIS